jgi:hypothetical protein
MCDFRCIVYLTRVVNCLPHPSHSHVVFHGWTLLQWLHKKAGSLYSAPHPVHRQTFILGVMTTRQKIWDSGVYWSHSSKQTQRSLSFHSDCALSTILSYSAFDPVHSSPFESIYSFNFGSRDHLILRRTSMNSFLRLSNSSAHFFLTMSTSHPGSFSTYCLIKQARSASIRSSCMIVGK